MPYMFLYFLTLLSDSFVSSEQLGPTHVNKPWPIEKGKIAKRLFKPTLNMLLLRNYGKCLPHFGCYVFAS